MARYIARKLLLAIPLLWGVLTLTFLMVELAPGTAADKFFGPGISPGMREAIEARYGLDQSAWVRYLVMLRHMALLDFGESISQGRPVLEIIAEALPNTLLLSAVILCAVYPAGVVLGSIQAVHQGRATDTGISLASLFFYSMPSFWLAMMLQLLFAHLWSVLPAAGMHDAVMYDGWPWWRQLLDRGEHLVLPGIALGLASAAGVARHMRSSLLEVIRQDYIRTARAKGLSEPVVIVRHGIRNALLPIVTLFGLSLPFLFSGSVLIEHIFAWPGMGRLIVQSIFAQDTPVIIACFFVFAVVVQAGNLLADVLYAVLDPRISYD